MVADWFFFICLICPKANQKRFSFCLLNVRVLWFTSLLSLPHCFLETVF